MKSRFQNLFKYDAWANQLIWESIAQKPILNPKIETLFSHLLSAQKVWLNRCTNQAVMVNIWETTTNTKELMEQNNQQWQDFLDKLNDTDFDQIITYQNFSGIQFETKLSDILTHLINHGTYHRGQIVQLIKPEREILPQTDYILWAR
jgi:uncharacterized damage-inducible protein DinB